MKRKNFLKATGVLTAIGMLVPSALLKANGNIETTLEDSYSKVNLSSLDGLLEFPTYERISNKYLSEKVKSFRRGDFEIRHDLDKDARNRPVERIDLQGAYMQIQIKGRKVEEKDIKRFCEIINKCAEDGIIEYGIFCPMFSLQLATHGIYGDQINRPETHLLMFYTFSKYSTNELKKMNQKYFSNEGELLTDF